MEKKKDNKTTSIIIIATILAVAIIILLISLFNGSTTTTGDFPDNVSDKSLVCVGNSIDYPIFVYDKSTKKEVKINMLFSKNSIKSIALTYSLYYNDTASVSASEAHNHAAMNESFGANGLSADAFSAKYAKLDGRMQMNLYAASNEINGVALRYFMINTNDNNTPGNLASYKAIYEDRGLKCEESK